MKILHLTHNVHSGGAATYVRRLIQSNNSYGLNQELIVASRSGFFANELLLKPGGVNKIKEFRAKLANGIDRAISYFEYTGSLRHRSFNFYGSVSAKVVNSLAIDLVHLHWINHGLISLNQVSKIDKPIVWSALDMWPFSGGDHYLSNDDLARFIDGYTKSNRTPGRFGIDLDRISYSLKEKVQLEKILFIYPSYWLRQVCESSSLGSSSQSIVIPPPIDADFFAPTRSATKSVSDKENYFVIGFGGGVSARKGWGDVRDLFLELISHGYRVKLTHFGGSHADNMLTNLKNYEFLGNIQPESKSLIEVLNGIDVLLFPSTLEAFGLLAQEAQSCGTPVIVRSGTGSEDIVIPGKTGWLFSDSNDLIHIVRYLLRLKTDEMSVFRKQARLWAEDRWSYGQVSKAYSDAYKDWIGK